MKVCLNNTRATELEEKRTEMSQETWFSLTILLGLGYGIWVLLNQNSKHYSDCPEIEVAPNDEDDDKEARILIILILKE